MERDVALMRVRLLEAEKVKVEESITRLEGELVEASFGSGEGHKGKAPTTGQGCCKGECTFDRQDE